jgi:hypothetical protein
VVWDTAGSSKSFVEADEEDDDDEDDEEEDEDEEEDVASTPERVGTSTTRLQPTRKTQTPPTSTKRKI